jgi:hypothetical protein
MSRLYSASDKIVGGRGSRIFGAAQSLSFSAPSFAAQNTTDTNAGTDDQYGWTQGNPYFLDKNNNEIAGIQWSTGTVTNSFVFRNVGGSWANSSVSEGALIHGTVAYDSPNNLLHVLWYSTGLGTPPNGYVYRRYVIQYSGNNITNIVPDTGITIGGGSARTNLVVDAQALGFLGEHPSLALLPNGTYGTIVAAWPMQSSAGVELRISMCAMGASGTAAQSAGNWTNPLGGATATTAIGGVAPTVAYGKVYSNAAASQVIPFNALRVKANGTNVGDLCVVYATGSNIGTFAYQWVRLRYNSGASNWSTGLSTPVAITNVQRAGSDTGYTLKYQLISNIVEDGGGNAYVGLATWNSGDTWGYARILDGTETVALVDAYNAGGVHSYAPTGHIAYDPASGLLLVSYVKTTTQFAFAKAFSGTTQAIAETAIFSAAKVDIPYFLTGNPVLGGKVPMILRDSGTTTHVGYGGTVTLS